MVEGGITDPTEANIARLADLEKQAAESAVMFVRCLWAIQTEGLFRWKFDTFASYVQEVWGLSKSELGRRQRQAAVCSEINKRVGMLKITDRVPKGGGLLPILTSDKHSKALARVPSEKLDAVLDELEGTSDAIPTRVAVKRAIERHVEPVQKQNKAKPGKRVEVSVRADVLNLGRGLVTAAEHYDDGNLANVIAAAVQQLRGIAKRVR